MYSKKIYQIGATETYSNNVVPMERYTRQQKRQLRREKNPATAAFLSAIAWGFGQIYADAFEVGMYFFMAQMFSVASLLLTWRHHAQIFSWSTQQGISEAAMLCAGVSYGFLLAGLWIFNILHAYGRAQRYRKDSFNGVDSLGAVLMCSFILPGLGQLMNAQRKKATFVLLFPFLTFGTGLSAFWAWIFWGQWKNPLVMQVAEGSLVVFGGALLLSFLVGLLALQDSVKMYLYPGKKQALSARVRFALNRWRKSPAQAKKDTVVRFLLQNAVILIIAAMVLHAGWHYFPRKYYREQLAKAALQLQARGYVVAPQVLESGANYLGKLPSPEAFYASW